MDQEKFQEKVKKILSGVKAIKKGNQYIVEGEKFRSLGLPFKIIYENPERLLRELEEVIKNK